MKANDTDLKTIFIQNVFITNKLHKNLAKSFI